MSSKKVRKPNSKGECLTSIDVDLLRCVGIKPGETGIQIYRDPDRNRICIERLCPKGGGANVD